VPPPSERASAVVGFTAHILVAADVDQAFIDARLERWQLSDAFVPPFLADLLAAVGRRAGAIDMLMLAPPLPGPPPVDLKVVEDLAHPRVERASRYRDDLTIRACDGGVLVLGRGLAGRREAAIEVDEDCRGRGLGRALAVSARHLVDGPLWIQVTPGNVPSVRAFLAAGFRPVGQETLLVRP
jgi:GNAT superfamily N-acetyltransferase